MKTEKQLRKRKEELEMLILLMKKYGVLVSQIGLNRLKAQITNIDFLLDENEEEDLKDE